MGDRTWMNLTVPTGHYELHKKEFEGGKYSGEEEAEHCEDGLTRVMYYEIDGGGQGMREEMVLAKIPHLFSHGPGGDYPGYQGVFIPSKLNVECQQMTSGTEYAVIDPLSNAEKGAANYPAMVFVLTEAGWDLFHKLYAPTSKWHARRELDEKHPLFNFIGRYGDTILAAMRQHDWVEGLVLEERLRLTLYEKIATLYQIWQDLPMPSRTITDVKR